MMIHPSASNPLAAPLTLPCGAQLPNRIAKAAMSEQLADRFGAPTPVLEQLYAAWARGGAGLLITGNVMIDGRYLVEPRNVVLDDERHMSAVKLWSAAARSHGATVLMQINHPGRVAVLPLFTRPVAPSAIPLALPGLKLRKPRELARAELAELVRRFARTAELAIAGGFHGVQVHAAHGYLLSQFLSPIANQRTDEYGGDVEGRQRLLLDVVRAVRAAIGARAVLSVKLNASDFQRGGFSHEDSIAVALALESAGVDLLEISGGTYESPAMTGVLRDVAIDRRAYFVSHAEAIRAKTRLPLMLTGGLRSAETLHRVVTDGLVDVVGLGRPFAMVPDVASRLLAGQSVPDLPPVPTTGFLPIDSYLQLAWHAAQFRRIARAKSPRSLGGLVRTFAAFGPRMALNIITQT